jgi:hypothetical protein
MTRINTFAIKTRACPSDALIQAIARLRTLRHLIFEATPLMLHPELSLRFHHLDSITFILYGSRFSDGWPLPIHSPDSPLGLWRNTLTRLLVDNQATLRVVNTPAALISFHDMSVVPWPNLRSLILTDCSPTATRYPDVTSIPALVHRMPKLEDMRLYPLEFSAFCEHQVTQRPSLDSSPTEIEGIEPSLHHLTISNLQPKDSFLSDLPGSVRFVAILSACYSTGVERLVECGLKSEHATRVLDDMSTPRYDFYYGDWYLAKSKLEEFCMVLDERPSVELVRKISICFPLLKRLQLSITHFHLPPLGPSFRTRDELNVSRYWWAAQKLLRWPFN